MQKIEPKTLESDDMGRIKTMPVKRATNQLVKAYPAAITKSFAENKLYVNKYMDAKSKKSETLLLDTSRESQEKQLINFDEYFNYIILLF